ncbi:MAG TPA: cytochrome c [Trueperaceae bacterium]
MNRILKTLPFLLLFALSLAFAQTSGEDFFNQNCAACHQATGQGIPGAFPPLAGHVPDLLSAEGGHDYVVRVLLYGLQGPITVNGKTYNGAMPAWGHLTDDQIAAVLGYVATAWGNKEKLPEDFQAITAEDVAGARGLNLTPQQVHELRSKVVTNEE